MRQLILMFIVLSSCTPMGPRASIQDPPPRALEEALAEAAKDPLVEIADEIPKDWWSLFQDDQLTCFIETTLARNPTLQEARASVLLATYTADRVRSTLFPNINWGADISRQKFSETGIIPFNIEGETPQNALFAQGGAFGIPVYFTQYETEFTFSWDFDIWGKNRNTLCAALGEVQTKLADEQFTRLELAIAVAEVYYKLQIDYQRREIAKALVNNQSELLLITNKRVQSNLDNILSVNNVETNLAFAKQALLVIEADIAVKENQLRAYLAGDFEEMICQVNIEPHALPQVPVPKDLPLHLIAHRPDIMAQLWVIESAGDLIEVAKAGFYPDFNLTGFIGFQTIHFPKLFQGRSGFYDVDPAVNLPIFEGGRLYADLNARSVNYDAAIFEYNSLVLNAVKEVLDGFTVLHNSEQQFVEFKKQRFFREENVLLTQQRVKHHLGSIIDTLASEQNALLAKDQEAVALGKTIQAMLALIKALGGGYEACYYEYEVEG